MVSTKGSPFLDQIADLGRPGSDSEPSWLRGLRERGFTCFQEAGFPDPQEETWRFTRLKSLQKERFAQPDRSAKGPESTGISILNSPAHRMVFVNGIYSPDLSGTIKPEPGLRVESLRDVWADDTGIASELGNIMDLNRHRFGALNTAFMNDGALVRVAAGVQVEAPIHLIFLSHPGKEPVASYPRVLLIAEEGSEVTLLEEYLGDSEATYFTSAVSEIVVRPNASVNHIRLEREGTKAFHIGVTAADLDRDGRFSSHALSTGGKLVRADIDTLLRGEGSECRLNGLYLAGGRQHVDHHTRVEHATPHTTSHEHYKGVLDGKATGVFNGRVIIQPQAQKVEAGQTNNNLLLSKDALVNTNPELEIFADDVKAQHGATIGQLDHEHLFYLRSRGLDEQLARRVLIHAFAGEMIEQVPHPELREKLAATVNERF